MQVVDPSTMQVTARVNQVDFPYLHLGQRLKVFLDAYPILSWTGRLSISRPSATPARYRRRSTASMRLLPFRGMTRGCCRIFPPR